jgi:MoaA/NifB/PqqE/SkfB family radical SAM enzyme
MSTAVKELPSVSRLLGQPLMDLLWLEITGKCNLACVHCYAESSPSTPHGSMTMDDWRSVIQEAASLGVRAVQFIGGEPTVYPGFGQLVEFAGKLGLSVEVYSNLFHVTEELWTLFERYNVSLATSFYSTQAEEHSRVTLRMKSFDRTVANIREAISRSLRVRVGIIQVFPDQDVEAARNLVKSWGVEDVEIDGVRAVGRGRSLAHAYGGGTWTTRPEDALCGRCGDRRAAVGPNGELWPCVMARWIVAGNMHDSSLRAVMTGSTMGPIRDRLRALFELRKSLSSCMPPDCPPGSCRPG